MKQPYIYILITGLICVSCSAIKETSNQQFTKGTYRVSSQKYKDYYASVDTEKISLDPVVKRSRRWVINNDTASVVFLPVTTAEKRQPIIFLTRCLDFDVLTILFKYRPYTSGFANQLNTNFNGGGYIGYRSDYYLLSYYKNPVNKFEQTINHFAYSVGLFGGLGATNMNPFVTGSQIQSEYDGVVITKGIGVLIGLGNLTFGAAVGLDHLMDKNHKVWIYQGKSWAGLTVGLNLN